MGGPTLTSSPTTSLLPCRQSLASRATRWTGPLRCPGRNLSLPTSRSWRSHRHTSWLPRTPCTTSSSLRRQLQRTTRLVPRTTSTVLRLCTSAVETRTLCPFLSTPRTPLSPPRLRWPLRLRGLRMPPRRWRQRHGLFALQSGEQACQQLRFVWYFENRFVLNRQDRLDKEWLCYSR